MEQKLEYKLEYKHRKDLDDSYLLYSVLRDLYISNSKNDKIVSLIITKVGRNVFNRYKILLKSAIMTVNQLLKHKHIKKSDVNKLEINVINSNKDYFKRLFTILEDIYINKKINSLLYEIKLEKNDYADF